MATRRAQGTSHKDRVRDEIRALWMEHCRAEGATDGPLVNRTMNDAFFWWMRVADERPDLQAAVKSTHGRVPQDHWQTVQCWLSGRTSDTRR